MYLGTMIKQKTKRDKVDTRIWYMSYVVQIEDFDLLILI